MTVGDATACAECARLEHAREAARRAGDFSRATDCAVLLRRHPEHGRKQPPDVRGVRT
ncbi:hypothetical protein [Streptomyces sp. WMMB303]|uniref:hypothetical protein n=1 Tax=Streptomyces sp. WMMB303 TaxID=3034154 RepID=UPI0023ED7493|nr:hypothetical protein [Streptomyces sp. WMMB303]MDF4250066.1 hypothetical protein [Streptomyces sp. WMMB303]